MPHNHIGVVGATSLVGQHLLPILVANNYQIIACSRKAPQKNTPNINWQQIPMNTALQPKINDWLWVAPIWLLADYFDWLLASGMTRIVVVSSTSRFTKVDSSSSTEQQIVQRLINGEQQLQQQAILSKVAWLILRPTLIYDLGKDKNITAMANFINKFGFFPVLGQAKGLRQPVYAKDVAMACYLALTTKTIKNQSYNLSGAEILSYRQMVERVFLALKCQPRILTIPLGIFRLALFFLHLLPRYRHWTVAMAERMNQDMTFEHQPASNDFGFNPQSFNLDLPTKKSYKI